MNEQERLESAAMEWLAEWVARAQLAIWRARAEREQQQGEKAA